MNRKDIFGGLVITLGILAFVGFSYLGTAQELITPGNNVTLPQGRDIINRNFTKIFAEVAAGTAASVTQLGTGAPLVNKNGRVWTALTVADGANTTISTVGGTLKINASASGIGDITGGASLGTGAAVFESEDTGTLRFRSLVNGGQMTIGTTATTITLSPNLSYPSTAAITVGANTGQLFGDSNGRWFINFGVDNTSSDMTDATGALNVNGGVHTTNGSTSVVAFGPRNANSNTGMYFSTTPGEILLSSSGTKAIAISATSNVTRIGTPGLSFSWGKDTGAVWATLSSSAVTLADNSDFTVAGTGGVTSSTSALRVKKPLKLLDYTTGTLPAPSTAASSVGILVNNTTTNTIYYSDGVAWYSLPKLLGTGSIYGEIKIKSTDKVQLFGQDYMLLGGAAAIPTPFSWSSTSNLVTTLNGGVTAGVSSLKVPIDGAYRIHWYATVASTTAARLDFGVASTTTPHVPLDEGGASSWVIDDTSNFADDIGTQTISGETIQNLTADSAIGLVMRVGNPASSLSIKIKDAGFNVLYIGQLLP